MKKFVVIIILVLFSTSCVSTSYCSSKATNRGGGYYV